MDACSSGGGFSLVGRAAQERARGRALEEGSSTGQSRESVCLCVFGSRGLFLRRGLAKQLAESARHFGTRGGRGGPFVHASRRRLLLHQRRPRARHGPPTHQTPKILYRIRKKNDEEKKEFRVATLVKKFIIVFSMEEESFSTLSDCIQSSCSSQRTVPLFGFLCGSRAWGVSDVSSDYDVRVLFWPVDEDDERIPDSFCVQEDRGSMKIEVQGWDVRKCVRLLCSFNATLAEWLASKCIFAADKVLLRAWQAAVAQTPPSTFVPFYLGLLKSERRKHLGGRKEVVLAEYLHAARPALMLNALSAKKDCVFPDTRFDVLLSIGGVPEDARSFLADLASRKRSGALRRGEEGAHSRFVDKWFDELEERHSKTKAAPLSESLLSLFRNLISRSRIAAQAPVKEVRVAVVHLSDYKDSFGRSYGELMFELLSAANASAQSGVRLRG